MEGWIKPHRKIVDHWIFEDNRYYKWWSIILLYVNHAPKKIPVQGKIFTCKAGQSIRSIESWSKLFGCTRSTTSRFFDLLKSDNMVITETVGQGSRRKLLLTVENWEEFQANTKQKQDENEDENEPQDRLKTNSKVGSNKKEKNLKKVKNIEERKKDFAQSLSQYEEKYGRDMLNSFYDYWTEHGDNDKKMRFEKEKSFGLARRLSTWKSNENKYETNRKSNGNRFESDSTKCTIENIYKRLAQKS
ncbi:hypothetical protein OU798_02080 [Prolixibacteraceae bacterium Z1-6]|uniref:Uncharacterized protein n=1 Tax=Draconibacterium aestuarii TaxID=2998507 RepID=A0A9X3J499_9BACT|nr:hypothetical protein [Prolixibacteraceae bacterium Z1-6]